MSIPGLASNLSAGYPPSVLESVARRRLAGPTCLTSTKGSVPQLLPSENRKVGASLPATCHPWHHAELNDHWTECSSQTWRAAYHGHKPPGLLVTNLDTEHGEIHKNNREIVQQAGRLDVADVQL